MARKPSPDHLSRDGRSSSAVPLACLAVALVVYASLYPFKGWRWPVWVSAWDVFALPLPPYRQRFDIWANYLGYVPVAWLVHVAGVHRGARPGRCWWFTVAAVALLSYTMEVIQQFLPQRYPSRLDWALNTAGAVAGASISSLLLWLGWVERWQRSRDRWFVPRSGGALALLLAWPLGLLFPTPYPLGMGPTLARVQAALLGWLSDVRGVTPLLQWLESWPRPEQQLPPLTEELGIAFGLLAPCLVAFAVTRPGWRRLLLAAGALALGLGTTTLSAAMNFGPGHALAWWTPVVGPGCAIGFVVAAVLVRAPARLVAGLGLVVVGMGLGLVSRAPLDPYFALSLQAWEQGRFIHFHGLAQWVGWLWPVAAFAWLSAALFARRPASQASAPVAGPAQPPRTPATRSTRSTRSTRRARPVR